MRDAARIDTEIPIIIEIIRIPRVSRYIKATMLVAGVLLYTGCYTRVKNYCDVRVCVVRAKIKEGQCIGYYQI